MIRRILVTLSAVILVLALVSTAVASNGTQIGTVGAKSTAMGSAFRGLSDDWSAGFFNPAGITQFGKWNIGASAGLIMPRGSYQAYPYPMLPSPALVTGPVDATAKNFVVPALGVFYKATEKLSVGLSVYAPFGLGTEWDLFKIPAGYGNAKAISKEKESYSDHQVIDIQPTVAYKFSEKLSIGAGFSYIWGKMTLDQVNLAVNPVSLPANWALVSMVPVLMGGTTPWAWNSDQNRIIAETNLDGDGTAIGGNVGLLFKPSEKISIGLSGRFSSDLKLKGDMTQTIAYPGDLAKYQTLVALATALAASGDPVKMAQAAQLQTAAGVFSGANVPTTFKNISANLPLPWTIGAGIALKPTSRWTLTADASLSNWSAWDEIVIDKGTEAGTDKMLENWKNTLELGAGLEFKAVQKEGSELFLRAGGYTVDSPVPNATMNPTLLDPARRYVATAGVGLTMGKVSIDFAFEHVFFGDKDIPASEYVFDPAKGYAENYAGIYKFNANVFTIATTISL